MDDVTIRRGLLKVCHWFGSTSRFGHNNERSSTKTTRPRHRLDEGHDVDDRFRSGEMEYRPSEMLCKMAATVDPIVAVAGSTMWTIWKTEGVRRYPMDGSRLIYVNGLDCARRNDQNQCQEQEKRKGVTGGE